MTTVQTHGADDALLRQVEIMNDAIGIMREAVANIGGKVHGATWVDVSRFAHIADAARRFVETIEESAV